MHVIDFGYQLHNLGKVVFKKVCMHGCDSKDKHLRMRLNNPEYLIILDKFKTFDVLYFENQMFKLGNN